MGGDHGCGVVIEGVKRALEADQKITALYLVGKQEEIQAALAASRLRDHRVQIVHASEVLTMEDKPTAALRKKKDSSMARAIELVGEGKADAVISLGNTGGILALATFKLRRLPGVERAGIATRDSRAGQRICAARFRRQHRMQAGAPGAIRRHGQHLFARNSRATRSRASGC